MKGKTEKCTSSPAACFVLYCGLKGAFSFSPRTVTKCWLLKRGLSGMLKGEGKNNRNGSICMRTAWPNVVSEMVCSEACFLDSGLREDLHL